MKFTARPDCQIPTLSEIYERYLPDMGRFVEVGAYDGVTISNTVMLTEAGWTGLYIEPHPVYAEKCDAHHGGRPNIHLEQVAISDFDGTADLYDIGECSSIVWDQNAVDWGGNKERKFTVPVTTLDGLLTRLNWQPNFELLVIDVEQSELKVLAGFSLLRWLPKMAIIETHEKDRAAIRNYKAAPIDEYFCERGGYAKIYADHINSIFIR